VVLFCRYKLRHNTVSEKEMPAVEAGSYELAFHVLPTIAEGEVETVFQKLKDTITSLGGVITTEEAPARFDLAYEIVKYLEGRNRKFSSAYFGWVRFEVDPAQITELNEALEGDVQLLRFLLIRLTKSEVEHPFYFHEALDAEKRVETVDVDEALKSDKEGDAQSEAVTSEVSSDEEKADDTASTPEGEESKEKAKA
jgi:ribosomal protein S6